MEEYTAWANVPENLKTKTGLKELGKKPAKGQEPVAIFRNKFNGKKYKLYDIAGAIERPPATERQLAILAKAREKIDRLRRCTGYGTHCGEELNLDDYGYNKRIRINNALREQGEDISKEDWQYVCRFCRDKERASEWARGVLADEGAVILDTETTGLDETAEIIEIAIINTRGETLFNSLVKPKGPMGGTHIHGISEEVVKDAPSWPHIEHLVRKHIQGASRVIVYNAEYDKRLIEQSQEKYSIQPWGDEIKWHCAMEAYAMWVGDWSEYHQSYKWRRLEGGHRALGDCLACLEYIKRMAAVDTPPQPAYTP